MLVPSMADSDLDLAISSKSPVLCVFSARWCAHCRTVKSVIRKWAAAHPEVVALDVDVERFESVANKYRVQSMPTLMCWIRGERSARQSGLMSEESFGRWVGKHLVA